MCGVHVPMSLHAAKLVPDDPGRNQPGRPTCAVRAPRTPSRSSRPMSCLRQPTLTAEHNNVGDSRASKAAEQPGARWSLSRREGPGGNAGARGRGPRDLRHSSHDLSRMAGGPSVENDSTSDIIDSSVPLEVVAVVTVVLSLKSVRGV